MFKNLPLLTPSKTVYSSTKMKHVTYEDISRCGDTLEVKELLDPKHSVTEMRSHLEQFGDIEDIILFDYSKDDVMGIITNFSTAPSIDEMQLFDSMMARVSKNEEIKSGDMES